MKKTNLLTFVTTATLIALCSTTSAASDETETTPVAAPIAETIEESQTNDLSTITEPAAIEDIETEESAATETVITPPVSDIQYTCQHDNSERIIRVFNDTATGLACEVTYEKSSGTQTLWSAGYDKEYCAQKASDFAAKQVGWGWRCVNKEGVEISVQIESPIVESSVTEAPAEIEEINTEAPEVELPEAETSEAEMPEVEASTNE